MLMAKIAALDAGVSHYGLTTLSFKLISFVWVIGHSRFQ